MRSTLLQGDAVHCRGGNQGKGMCSLILTKAVLAVQATLEAIDGVQNIQVQLSGQFAIV